MSLYELDQLICNYNGRTVLAIDHWSLAPGSIIGLVGANGSGKSTLLKLLGFVARPTAGEIRFNGRLAVAPDIETRRQVALLPQETHLLKRTIYNNVAYGLRVRKQRHQESECVRQALEWVGLPPDSFASRPWFALSGGEARRVALAARLVLRPQVLLLDEPTTSVDVASAQRMKTAALHAHRQWGTSLIIASHDQPWLQDICDDVVHLFAGSILGTGPQTLLFGPWEEKDLLHLRMRLTDSQYFVARKPALASLSAGAAIDPRRLTLLPPGEALSEAQAVMEGIVANLALDKRAGGIIATVEVGYTEFRVLLPTGHPALSGLVPGRAARIAYAPGDVSWYA